MENPFKQFLPEEEPAQEAIEEKVMESVRLKSHFAGILEFFLSFLGVSQEGNAAMLDEEQEPGSGRHR